MNEVAEGAVLRDKALDMLEEKRHEWIALARKTAFCFLKHVVIMQL